MDITDLKILAILQEDASLPVAEIPFVLHLEPSSGCFGIAPHYWRDFRSVSAVGEDGCAITHRIHFF